MRLLQCGMRHSKTAFGGWIGIVITLVLNSGCGSFMARRMAQAPNSYPDWFAPQARVTLGISGRLITNFPSGEVVVGPPLAKLHYRVATPANYHLQVLTTNWSEKGRAHFKFDFKAVFSDGDDYGHDLTFWFCDMQ